MRGRNIGEELVAFRAKRRILEKVYNLSAAVVLAVVLSFHILTHLLGVYDKQIETYFVMASFIAWLLFGWGLDFKAKAQSCPYCGEPAGIKLVWPRNFICKRCWHDLKMK
ncbi:hypothetical protein [Rhizobium sp. BG4]|uniref:hypothetical protein n=1 Tax=Rhizobium sp. BG4 TaxID=2613770 RepID=UPI00193DD2A1|nr:hypothetical protein [Rhizobium sp. BG4]QRM42676.1 hypothetical protein F2982_04110 [Rhizobium sp. BG4]